MIVKEKTWLFTSDGEQVAGSGLGEEYIYDTVAQHFGLTDGPTDLLLLQKRSVGWSAVNSTEQDEEGLVQFYEYMLFEDDPSSPIPMSSRVQLAAEGLQQGSVGSLSGKMYTRQFFRDEDRPDTVTTEVEFLEPVDEPLGVEPAPGSYADFKVTQYLTTETGTGDAQRVTSRQVVHPPRQQRPGGDWYYPTERELYDDTGQMTWSITGIVKNPASPSGDVGDPLSSLVFSYYDRDGSGRARATVINVAQPQISGSIAVPAEVSQSPIPRDPCPAGWPRIGAVAAAEYITAFKYDDYGPSDIFFPNGRRFARRWVVRSPADDVTTPTFDESTTRYVEEFLFNNIQRESGGGEEEFFSTESPGERKEYEGTRPVGTPRVSERGVFGTPDPSTGEMPPFKIALRGGPPETAQVPDFVPFAQVRLALDANGRPANADLLEFDDGVPPSLQLVGSKEVNELVDVRREREIDGTITRLTRDLFGHHMRTYVGTDDTAWGLDRARTDTEGQYIDEAGVACYHNMVLIERMQYGLGSHDAWLPVVRWRYARHPSWADEFYVPPAADVDGYPTITGYDWRMRPVRVDVFDKGGLPPPLGGGLNQRMSTTLTYLDHADRARLVVTFGRGADIPATLDPTQRDGATMPTIASLYALSPKPTSIVETIYDADDRPTEIRRYDLSWTGTGAPPYQAEYHYFGQGSVEVFTQRPGQPTSIAVLDGLGRVAETRTVRPDLTAAAGQQYVYEITKTVNIHDATGNVVESTRYERVAASGNALAATGGGTINAVRSRSIYWYDSEKRRVASAELGTEQYTSMGGVPVSSTFTAGAASFVRHDPVQDPSSVPSATIPPSEIGAVAVSRANLPELAELSIFMYDEKSNLKYAIAPNQAVTKHVYDRSNRLTTKIENLLAADAKDRRETRYKYHLGRLVEMQAVSHSPQQTDDLQWTKVDYHADIADDAFDVVSGNNGLVGSMDARATSGSDAPVAQVRYNFSGAVAERIDPRGVSLRYTYDALERITRVAVGYYNTSGAYVVGYPVTMNPPGNAGAPLERAARVEYTYNDAGLLQKIETSTIFGPNTPLVARNEYTYDANGHLLTETQPHASTDTGPPTISYAWDYLATNPTESTGHDRLLSVTYPAHNSLAARVITLEHGTAGSVDNALSALTKLTSNLSSGVIAQFTYAGAGRRAAKYLAAGEITADFKVGAEAGLAGLDGFGRAIDLHYRSLSSATLFRSEYTYDASGNRVTTRLTQAPESGLPSLDVRSQFNEFNALNQLTNTQVGPLTFSATGVPSIPPPDRRREDSWSTDVLGNWNGNPATPGTPGSAGRQTTVYGTGGSSTTTATIHSTDLRNRIVTRSTQIDTGTPVVKPFAYDASGNLVCDGVYYYQYDAWNRLVQVNRAVQAGQPGGDGVIPWAPTLILKHYTYDGTGRLIRTQSPYPNPETAAGRLRSERFYYDGVRRIQEVVLDPIMDQEAMGGSPAGESGNFDESATTMIGEEEQIEGQTVTVQPNLRLEREYVWGPGGLDELLVQFDAQREPWWMVVDEGGDIMAMCDLGAAGGHARVVAQWSYDAYGDPLASATLYPHPHLHLSHKAIFLDRLDVSVVDPSTLTEHPRVIPFAHTLGYARNRTYSAGLGRWLQPDPREIGLTLLAESHSGRGVGALAVAFDLAGHYGDGMNPYEYLGSNPWNRVDPMGLSWDPFNMVDEYMAEAAGSNAAWMERIVGTARTAAYIGAVILAQLPFPISAIAADIGANALEGQVSPQLQAARRILGYASLGAVGVMVGKVAYSAAKAAISYLRKFGLRGAFTNLVEGVSSLASRAKSWLDRKPKVAGTCGCFIAGTLVWTASGMTPIEEIQIGDYVLAVDETTGSAAFREVTNAIVTPEAALLDVTTITAEGEERRIRTTDEHPFWLEERGWRRADQLQPGDILRTTGTAWAVVFSLTFQGERATVYNLTVEGSHTFLIAEDGVLVHNCDYKKLFVEHLESTGRSLPSNYHVHHRIPQKYRELFADRVDSLSNWAGVPDEVHWKINGQWNTFRARNPTPSAAQIEAFAAEIDLEYMSHYILP